jgi:hypothetical protein
MLLQLSHMPAASPCCLTLLTVLAGTKGTAHQIMTMITAYSSRMKRLQE